MLIRKICSLCCALFFCTSCIPLNYNPVIHCDNKLKATESQLHTALDDFFEQYPNNIVSSDKIGPVSDTSSFRKYYGFKISDRTDSMYTRSLMRAYYKVNSIPPGHKPRYDYTATSDNKKILFKFSVANCLADMKYGYDLPEDNICQLCLMSATLESDSDNLRFRRSFELTRKERKQVKFAFKNDILSKIERILEEGS